MRPIDYFDAAIAAYPRRPAVVDHRSQCTVTYDELGRFTHAVARGLMILNLTGEFRVAVCCPNDARFIGCLLGILRAGGVLIPISTTAAGPAIVAHLNVARAECFLCDKAVAARVSDLRSRVPTLRAAVCLDREAKGYTSLDELIRAAEGTHHGCDALPDDSERLTAIYQTGGTTGDPRGVLWTAGQWNSQVETNRRYLASRLSSTETPVLLAATEFTHRSGFVNATMLTLGATLVVMPNLDPGEVLRAIGSHRVTHLWVPPSGLAFLLKRSKIRTYDYSTLRYLLLGSAPVAPSMLREAVDVFGPVVCQSYGQTETGILTWMDASTLSDAATGSAAHRLRSCGKPVYSVVLRVLDEDGRRLPCGTVGEITVRGPSVSNAYLTDSNTPADRIGDGWHRTGDLGYVDSDGFVYIVDRKKDVVCSSGLSVYSVEIERTILQCSEVAECAVIGVPDEARGEAVKAIVVLQDGRSLSAEAVMRHCRAQLGLKSSPAFVEFVEHLPKTLAGKTDKRALRVSSKDLWIESL